MSDISTADARRTVLVTGAASGIGRGIARAFAATGDRVVIADLDAQAAEREATAIGGIGVAVDLREPDSVTAAVVEVFERVGRVDVLVNAAGLVAGAGPLTELPVDVFDHVVSVNMRGPFLMTRAVAPRMVADGVHGAIVNVTSIGSRRSTPSLGHYEATKSALDSLTRATALELAPHGIRVNAVAPGPVLTPMTAASMSDPALRAAWEERIPLGRIAEVEDVTPAVLFLASDGARHITGVSLPVDGGQLIR